ncbi:Alpha-galactosidase [Apiospora marii]|uniref:Alpha-galactosidase n=1 Tax=Apiospora marii TaxID=335849 RepID=UPI003130755C
MYTPSLVQIAVSGLLAASAVNSFELPGHRDLVARGAGALVAFAIPAMAAPVANIDAREPHHKGVKGGKKNNKRDDDEAEAEDAHTTQEEEDAAAQSVDKREPHHKGVKGGKKNGN